MKKVISQNKIAAEIRQRKNSRGAKTFISANNHPDEITNQDREQIQAIDKSPGENPLLRIKLEVVKGLPEDVEWLKAVGLEEAQDPPCGAIVIIRWYPGLFRSLLSIAMQVSGDI
jgi:hypothetical protein